MTDNVEPTKWRLGSIKVPTKPELKNKLPFKPIASRIANAIILSYIDYRSQACQLLQKLNHTGRAYIISQDGLRGFLVEDFFIVAHL